MNKKRYILFEYPKQIHFLWKTSVFVWLFIFLQTVLYGQPTTFMKVYYNSINNTGKVVRELTNGTYLIGARQIGPFADQSYLLNINQNGDTIKTLRTCGKGVDDLEQKDDSTIVFIGTSTICNTLSGNVYITEIDTSMQLENTFFLGDSSLDKGFDILIGDDHNYLIACYKNDPDLYKTDPSGNVIWSRGYGLSGLYRIKPNLEGGYFICGNAGGGFVDPMYVAKIDSVGNVIWYKTFYNPHGETFTDIEPMSDSGVIAVTDYNGLYKISLTGDSLWMKPINVPAQRLITAHDGNILIAGGGMSLTKVDTSGNIIWSNLYWIYPAVVGVLGYEGWDVIETSDGGYLLVGAIDSLGTKNLYMVKTDSLGLVATGLSNPEPDFSAHCYPQPFREQTTITLSNEMNAGSANKWELTVYNVQGILLREESISGFPYVFKRNNLSSGIYLYTITQIGKIPVTGKMVVE